MMGWEYYKDKLPLEVVQEVEKFKADALYNPDYVEYDQIGAAKIRCMRCGEVVISRVQVLVSCPACGKKFHALATNEMQRLAEYDQVRKWFGDTGYVDLVICKKCKPIVEGDSEQNHLRLQAQIIASTIKEMVWAKKTPERVKKELERLSGKKISQPKEEGK